MFILDILNGSVFRFEILTLIGRFAGIYVIWTYTVL